MHCPVCSRRAAFALLVQYWTKNFAWTRRAFLELLITQDTLAIYRLISPKYFIPLITLT